MADAATAFDVSGLSAYVKQSNAIISKAVLFDAPSLKYFVPQPDVKYKEKIHFLGLTGATQDGKGCTTEYNRTAALTDREIVTAIFEDKIKICPDTLLGYWGEYLVRIPADKRASGEIPFEAYLVDALIEAQADTIEYAIWQGDADTVSDPDLIDGIVTILGAESGTIDVTISAGTSMFAAVKQMIAALPAKLKKARKNLRVYLAPEHYEMLCFELVDANLFHYNMENGNPDSFLFPGTNVEVINALGLADSDAAVATTADNIYYGYDESNANTRVAGGWNEEHGYAWLNVRHNAGVQVAFPDWAVLAAFSGDPVSPDANAELAAIAASVAELADEDHIFKTDAQ